MQDGTSAKITWHGDRSVDSIPGLLVDHGRVELHLPADFHHAIFTRLNPDAPPGAVEDVDSRGGEELIEALAQVKGLSALGRLAETVRRENASVHIVSPAPLLVLTRPHGAERDQDA